MYVKRRGILPAYDERKEPNGYDASEDARRRREKNEFEATAEDRNADSDDETSTYLPTRLTARLSLIHI